MSAPRMPSIACSSDIFAAFDDPLRSIATIGSSTRLSEPMRKLRATATSL
jgi:hypothetical protein